MGNERGITMFELVVVLTLASIAVAMTIVYASPWLGRESMRGAVNHAHSFFQLTRAEAVSRNQACRLVVDTGAGRLTIWDSVGTSTTSDDVLLHDVTLPDSVAFERPDTGSAVTLEATGDPGVYQTVFAPNGLVSSGNGAVFLHGGDGYLSVAVYAAGATEITRWNGTGWVAGD